MGCYRKLNTKLLYFLQWLKPCSSYFNYALNSGGIHLFFKTYAFLWALRGENFATNDFMGSGTSIVKKSGIGLMRHLAQIFVMVISIFINDKWPIINDKSRLNHFKYLTTFIFFHLFTALLKYESTNSKCKPLGQVKRKSIIYYYGNNLKITI